MKYTLWIHVIVPLYLLHIPDLYAQIFTIMLDPAGDAVEVGRIIDDSFERSITLQCVHQLKKAIEKKTDNVRVILSRFPGETLEPLQNASFANRLNIDLFISLSFYHLTPSSQSETIDIYYALYHPVTDFWQQHKPSLLSFIPFNHSYLYALRQSADYAQQITHQLDQQFLRKNKRILVSCLGYPCKPLLGVIAPACLIEIGLRSKNDYKNFIAALTDTIIELLP